MKAIIKQKLKEEGGKEVKKLKKLVVRAVSDNPELYSELSSYDESSLKSLFDDTLRSLVDSKKLSIEDGIVKKCEGKSSTKRKAEPDLRDDLLTESNILASPSIDHSALSESAPLKIHKSGNGSSKSKYFDDLWAKGEQYYRDGTLDAEYIRTNPDQITRVFCGNLNKTVTEELLKNCIPGIVYIKWITDKITKAFYGSTFLEMKDPQAAIAAVMKDQSKFLGRPLKIYYCPPKPGDVWPPIGGGSSNKDGNSGGNGAVPKQFREKTPKPDNGRKLYAGNLAYDIDDDTIIEFFKGCGEIIGLRWLTNRETGEFRGSGYVEFATTEEADAAMKLDGQSCMGRPIRLDWTE